MQIAISGGLVDISHLKTIDRVMTLDLPRRDLQKKNARIEFVFSNHCYSRGPNKGEEIPLDMLVPDGSTHKPRNRIFCWTRYEHSKSLVQRIDNLIAANGSVRRSRHQNFFSTDIITTDNSGNEVMLQYFIFMSAQKKQDPNQPPKIAVHVESAYHEDPNIPNPQGVGDPVPFSRMLGSYWG